MDKYDIVYFVKECDKNEELKYSLRTVEQNFPHSNIWFYGGCPNDLRPDHYAKVFQREHTKWENVRRMLLMVCRNDNITENFWLFNDDFFVLQPVDHPAPAYYYKDLQDLVRRIELRHHGETRYTRQIKNSIVQLERAGFATRNYALHVPMLINREKALKTLQTFTSPMFRSLYGNQHNIGGIERRDCKIISLDKEPPCSDFLSTCDQSFRNGKVGEFIRNRYPEKSKFEKLL